MDIDVCLRDRANLLDIIHNLVCAYENDRDVSEIIEVMKVLSSSYRSCRLCSGDIDVVDRRLNDI